MAKTKIALRCALLLAASGSLLGGTMLTTANAAPGVPTISEGSSNTHGVWCVQHAIDNWAKRTGHGTPLTQDGSFGPATRTWVIKFQAASNLTQDGLVGINTGNSIEDNEQGYGPYCYGYVPSTRNS